MSKSNEQRAIEGTAVNTASAIGMTAEAFGALPADVQAKLVALTAAAKAKTKAVEVVLYADGCDQGAVVASGDRKGQRRSCTADIGKVACTHGKPVKGNIGITGLGQFPLSAYAGQWVRAFDSGALKTLETEARRLVAAGFGNGK